MISTYKNKNTIWIDLENPTQDEVRKIAETYGIDPAVANDLLSPSSHPVVNEYDGYLYLILQFPIATDKKNYGKSTEIQEVDFILGKNFVITNRYAVVDSLMEFSKTFTVNSVLDKSHISEHAGFIFYYMIKGLYDEMTNRLEHVKDLLKDAEDRIFNGEEKQMVVELSRLNRLLLHFKKAIGIHDEVLKDLSEYGSKIYGAEYNRYLRQVFGEYIKVRNSIENLKEYTNELRQTNDSLLTTKQNEIMKILTIMAFITFPLTLLTGIFGMNTIYTPVVGLPQDFWIVMIIMLVMTCIMFIYFKIKKWI